MIRAGTPSSRGSPRDETVIPKPDKCLPSHILAARERVTGPERDPVSTENELFAQSLA